MRSLTNLPKSTGTHPGSTSAQVVADAGPAAQGATSQHTGGSRGATTLHMLATGAAALGTTSEHSQSVGAPPVGGTSEGFTHSCKGKSKKRSRHSMF